MPVALCRSSRFTAPNAGQLSGVRLWYSLKKKKKSCPNVKLFYSCIFLLFGEIVYSREEGLFSLIKRQFLKSFTFWFQSDIPYFLVFGFGWVFLFGGLFFFLMRALSLSRFFNCVVLCFSPFLRFFSFTVEKLFYYSFENDPVTSDTNDTKVLLVRQLCLSICNDAAGHCWL